MLSIDSRVINLSVVIPPFLVISGSTIVVVSICHIFLNYELNPFTHKHLVVELPTALLATFLVVALFLHKRQFSKEVNDMELLRAEDDWEKTFNTMADFVSVHDKDFKIIKANQALCDFMGKSSEEIIGKYCYQLFHNTNAPFENCPHKKTSKTGHSVTEIINDPNIGVPLLITCSPLFDDETFQGSVHIARAYEPVAERRKSEKEVIPICASCKSIRKKDNNWVSPEEYFIKKYDYLFTHSICLDCQTKLYPEYIQS